MRPSIQQTLMRVAETMSLMGTCSRLQVGAVLARDTRIISTGWNGNPSGFDHCGVPHPDGPCETASHAEENVLLFAAKHGVSTAGSEIFLTHAPCYRCSRGLINAGVYRVTFKHHYRDMSGIALLRSGGVEVIDFDFMI